MSSVQLVVKRYPPPVDAAAVHLVGGDGPVGQPCFVSARGVALLRIANDAKPELVGLKRERV